MYALLFELIDFGGDETLGQTEFGYTVHEHAARTVERLVHGDFHAGRRQFAGAGEPGRPRTDDGDFLARRCCGRLALYVQHVVAHKPLDRADCDGAFHTAADAKLFALVFLRTDAAADRRQAVGRFDDIPRLFDVPFTDGF